LRQPRSGASAKLTKGDFLIAHDKKNPTKIEGNSSVFRFEIGHIEYDILYSSQPMSYRSGANPGRLSNTCHMTQQIIISSYSLNQSSLGPSFMFIIDRCLVYTG
jgi:hypothetical protein